MTESITLRTDTQENAWEKQMPETPKHGPAWSQCLFFFFKLMNVIKLLNVEFEKQKEEDKSPITLPSLYNH